MNSKGCRGPARIGRMKRLTCSWYAQRSVVGVDRLVVIGLVTTHAGGGRVVVVSTNMAAVAIHGCVSA